MVDCVGCSNGLVMLWKDWVNFEVLQYSSHHIHSVVRLTTDGIIWSLTGVYRHPVTAKRHEVWELIKTLKVSNTTPWLAFEDFNEILNMNEKIGGKDRSERQIEEFRNMHSDCNLKDLRFVGSPFT